VEQEQKEALVEAETEALDSALDAILDEVPRRTLPLLKYEPASEPLRISVKWLFLQMQVAAEEASGVAAEELEREVFRHAPLSHQPRVVYIRNIRDKSLSALPIR